MATGTKSINDSKKYVYLFDEYDEVMESLAQDWDDVRGLLGGKGANLLDATRLGIPVPPGFTVSTVAATTTWRTRNSFRPACGSRNSRPLPSWSA